MLITRERYHEINRGLSKVLPSDKFDMSIGVIQRGMEIKLLVDGGFGIPMQAENEVFWLLKRLEENISDSGDITTILELGTCDGGSLKIWEELLPKNKSSLLISVDIKDGILWDYSNSLVDIRAVIGNTHSDDTREKVKSILNGRKVDFLFIDASHTVVDVKQDFIDYGGFVGTNRIIAFHDTRMIRDFWNKFTANHYTDAFHVEEYQDFLGTGIFYTIPNQNVVKFRET